ncbi:MAG TPA: ATP-binding protein [Polyangiales bacterium]
MRLPSRLGLRAQIVLALSAVFALSFWLIGFATVQLTRRNVGLDELREQRLVAHVLVATVAGDSSNASLQSLCERLQSTAGLRALRLQRASGPAFVCGQPQDRPSVRTVLADGARLSLWLSPSNDPSRTPVTDLLLFYMSITGLSVLLLAYVALTHLIVRPLDRLTQSAAQLSHGGEHRLAREEGSAEVARLALTFNEMATMLRAERKRLVDRLAELERTTSELASKEQQLIHGEKLASIGRLAAGVAHEIGNPLAAILGLVELLRGGGLSESEAREFLERIQRETERINGIIRDLLDFARRDVDDGAQAQTADLRDVIDDAVNLVRPQKASRDVEISVTVDPATRRVIGPQHRLTQVLLNLLLNALDALDGKGAVEISVRPSDDGKSALLVVQDSGPGIAEQMRDKLFDPFTTTKPAGKGTGLGLAVSAAILDGLQGSIDASNRPEGGARFEVRLRQVPPAAERGGRVDP